MGAPGGRTWPEAGSAAEIDAVPGADQDEVVASLKLQARHAEELEKVKSDFLHLAAHELRGPIAVLRGYTAMLAEDFTERPVPARVAQALREKVAEVGALVEQMLETARIDYGRLELDLRPLDLVDVVSGIADGVNEAGNGHHVEVHAPPAIGVRGDRLRLEAIVSILLDNAVKYSPPGSPVVCELGTGVGSASLRVSDRGVGIASEHLDKLFGRFQRVPLRDGRRIAGTGLGLYVAREQARAHGGDITVDSEPEVGSTFTLTLPLRRVRGKGLRATPAALARSRPLRGATAPSGPPAPTARSRPSPGRPSPRAGGPARPAPDR
jgi:two-component system phosphate regulon sensor histidine kinase PhoR